MAVTKSLLEHLPPVRGTYRPNAELKATNWFRVGGPAEMLFKPADTQDLADFLRGCPHDIPITVIGVGSNLIVRDAGIAGVVIRLGRGFTEILVEGDVIVAGAAAMDVHVAQVAAEAGRAGLAFLSGIPGTIGGALAMNGGAYGREMKEVLIEAELVLRDGTVVRRTAEELHYRYRACELPEGAIFTRAWLRTGAGERTEILAEIARINEARAATQPIRSRTGGSTFKNPEGAKAWELIDAAGCRGLQVGGAQMSELHCNFMINTGDATASDLEALGEEVRKRVKSHSEVELQWEIKRIGKAS
jgi:UDP-N-acetylmuramate dehydrogenase